MNVNILNASGMNENVSVVRYFRFNGVDYLIFTKNEVDEAGYQKLYISKVVNRLADAIVDDIEWNLIKDTIQVIAKANREQSVLPVQDLNESDVNGMKIVNQKPFKLSSSSVALLCANKTVTNLNQSIDNLNTNTQQMPLSSSATVNAQPVFDSNNVVGGNVNADIPDVSDVSFSMPQSVVNVPNTNLNQESSVISQSNLNQQIVSPFDYNSMPNNVIGSQTNAINQSSLNANSSQLNSTDAVDYKKLYDDQTLKINSMTAELDRYKSIVEQLKDILK